MQAKYSVVTWLRDISVKPFAMAFVGLLGLAAPSRAASPDTALFADRDLGEALTQAVQALGPDAKRMDLKPSASAAACAVAPGAAPRLALLSHTPSRGELERCEQAASADVSVIEIGREAVALVVPIDQPVWAVDTGAVFRALGQNSNDTSRPQTWADVDPSYPRLPIGALVPPADSRTGLLFQALIMEPGCDKVATARTPFDRNDRRSFCTAVRNDAAVAQRHDDAQDVVSWASAASAGQIAIVSVAELRQLDRRVVPLLLNGALPTAVNIENGRYPAAGKIALMIVVPKDASGEQRAGARALAFNLLAEASIGPGGSLAPAGLIPLPPPERLAARSQAVALLEQR